MIEIRTHGSGFVSRFLALFVVSFLFLIVSPPVWGGEKVTIDGVVHVKNGDTPSMGRETLTLEEVWRVGGDDEEGILLGLVSEVCGDEQGNIYIMDAQLCQVHVFSPQGDLLRTIFRQGEGPGEIRQPRDLVVTKDGVGLAQEFPGKIVMVDREGIPMSNIEPTEPGGSESAGGLIAADFGGGNLVLSGMQFSNTENSAIQDRTNFLIGVSSTGEERARYGEVKTSYNFSDFTFIEREHTPTIWWGFAVDKDGNVYVAADRDAYAISVFNADGSLVRVIEREFELYKRTAQDKQRMHDLFDSAMSGLPFEVKFKLEDTEPVIDFFHRGVRVDDDGALWVTTSRGIRDHHNGALMTYDVFDRDGHFTKQVSMPCQGDSYNDCLFWISNDQVVLVTDAMAALAAQFGSGTALDSDDEDASSQEVICYSIKRDS
jgi:hypothetical protein